MRNEIRQILQNYDGVFPNTAADPVENLVISAMGGIDAYSRLKNSESRNMATDVFNLTRELRKKYFIEESAARAVIECIAELLGYIPPSVCEACEQEISVSAGDTVQFGDYDWRVLEVQDGKMLLLSESITEQRAYHPCYAGVTWEHSKLRQYLNNDFFNNFDSAEKDKILETKLSNPNNLWYGTEGGNDTFDRIFILNLEEADRYFGNSGDYSNIRRKKYDNGKWVADDGGWILSNGHDSSRTAKHNGLASFWWLRSAGYSDCTAAYVSTTGNIPCNGDRVCIGRGGVRPALWRSLSG
jgi:hypothetical protein